MRLHPLVLGPCHPRGWTEAFGWGAALGTKGTRSVSASVTNPGERPGLPSACSAGHPARRWPGWSTKVTPEQHRGCDCRGVGAPRQPGAPGLRVGAIATAFTAWTLLPLPTAQTQCSVLGWNTHQPSDTHEFVPVMKRKRLRRRREKKTPHTYTHTHRKGKAWALPLPRWPHVHPGRRLLTTAGFNQRGVGCPGAACAHLFGPGLAPRLAQAGPDARDAGGRFAQRGCQGAGRLCKGRALSTVLDTAGCPGVGVCGGGNDTRTEGSRGFTL